MLDTPQIVQTHNQLYAYVSLTIPRDEIQSVMGPTLQEVHGVLAALGIAPSGAWFTHHLKMDSEVFDFEICVPVAKAISPTGRVKLGQWPSIKVARTVYHGDYEGLGEAWGEFMDWIEAHGHKTASDLWERYTAGPESSPDPANWSTELSRPLLD